MNSTQISSMSKIAFYVLFTLILIMGCSSSNQVKNNWTDPEVTAEDFEFKQVVVLALLNNNDYRKIVEDEIAKRMVRRIGVPAYKVIERDELSEVDAVKKKLVDRGFDGALVIRILNSEERSYYSPGHYAQHYYSFSNYYSYSYPYVYDPGGRMETETETNLEINIYSLINDKLLWSGQTKTYNNINELREATIEISKSLAQVLIDDGLLEAE